MDLISLLRWRYLVLTTLLERGYSSNGSLVENSMRKAITAVVTMSVKLFNRFDTSTKKGYAISIKANKKISLFP